MKSIETAGKVKVSFHRKFDTETRTQLYDLTDMNVKLLTELHMHVLLSLNCHM